MTQETWPPNLDGLSAEDLIDFQSNLAYKKAKRHWPHESPEAIREALRLLDLYARYKILAIVGREAGKIRFALRYEEKADDAYNHLPQFARW